MSIDTQPVSVDTPTSLGFRENLLVEDATPPGRKIFVVSPNEYKVYNNEESNAQTMDGRIINVSEEDIELIHEMADSLGGRNLSIPQYERCFQMHGFHPTHFYPPEPAT